MKIKKLLTLLVVTALISGCGGKGKKGSSANNRSSSPDSSVTSSLDNGSSQGGQGSSQQQGSSSAQASSSQQQASSSQQEASSSAQASSSSQAPTLSGIALNTDNVKKQYEWGENLNLAGLVVTANFSDGSNQAVTDYTTNPANGAALNQAGNQNVVVSYQGQTAEFAISVAAPALVNITLDTANVKKEYAWGENLDLSNLVVTANYSDNSSQPVTDFTTNPANGTKLTETGAQNVVVTFGDKTNQFEINVAAPVLVSIAADASNVKKNYEWGENLDLTGLVVTGTYSDDSQAPITDFTTNPANGAALNQSGKSNVEVAFGGKTDSFEINVAEPVLMNIALNADNVKKEYAWGENLDLTGLVVNATFSDGNTRAVTDFTSDPADGSKLATAGKVTVTISFGGKTGSFDINVAEPVLVSIAANIDDVKTEYAYGEALDLTGLVVNGTYSDESVKPVNGYTTNPENGTALNVTGKNDVEISFEGKTTSFEITVANPIAWGDDVKALFAENIYGYDVPFFYGPAYGVGELDWDAQSGTVYAFGGIVNLADEPVATAFAQIAQLFKDDGFTATKEIDLEGKSYYYSLIKEVTYQTNKRNIEITLGVNNGQGKMTTYGYFYIDLSDPYIYSWADTQLEATLRSYFGEKFAEDIPDLPDGGIYTQANLYYTSVYMSAGAPSIPVWIKCDESYAYSVISAFATADPAWTVFATEDGYSAISPEEKIRIDGSYNDEDGELKLDFSIASQNIPANVATVAGLLGISKYQFTKGSSVYYFASLVTLNDGESSLSDLFDRFDAILTAGDILDQRGTKEIKADSISANYFNDEKALKVSLAVEVEDGKYYFVVYVRDLVAVPEDVAAIATAMGISTYDLDLGKYGWYKEQSLPANATDDEMKAAIAGFGALLLADDSLDMDALEDEIQDGHEGDWYINYANLTKKVEIWAYRDYSKEDPTQVIAVTLQITISDYVVPESAFKDALAAELGISFKWNNSGYYFYYNDVVVLGEGETYKSVVENFELGLMELDDGSLDYIEDGGGKDDDDYYYSQYYNNEGFIYLECSMYDKGADGEANTADDVVMVFVQFTMFDPNVPLMASLIGAGYGQRVTTNEKGQYQFMVGFGIEGYPMYLIDYVWGIDAVIEEFASYMAGFELQGEMAEDEEGVLIATYYNQSTGYTALISIPFDEEGNALGVRTILIPPAPQA